MSKRIYTAPTMELIEAETTTALLALSNPLEQLPTTPDQVMQDVLPSTDPLDVIGGELFG